MATAPQSSQQSSAPNGPASRPHPRRWPWVLGAGAVALVAFVWVFDWNWLKGPLERRVEAATGRSFDIGGDLGVEAGWPPTVVMEDVRFGNAEWSQMQPMASAERVAFELRLLPLLAGRLVLPRLELTRPYLLLERAGEERENWEFGDEDDGEGVPVGQLYVEAGELAVLEHDLDSALALHVQSIAREDGSMPLRLRGTGTWRGFPFSLRGSVDSPLELREGGEAGYEIDLQAEAGATQARARGALDAPLDLTRFTIGFALRGNDLEHLWPLLHIALPATPPYTLEGQLTREGRVWHYRDFEGTIGDSDLGGRATIDLRDERPMFKARLVADRLDFDDLGPTIGAPPGTSEEDTASEAQRKLAAQRAAENRLLPGREFRPERLRAMDAELTLDAAEVEADRVPVDALSLRLRLRDGVLQLDPLNFSTGGGRVNGRVEMDATGDPIATAASLEARGLRLPELFPDAGMVEGSTGDISGSLDLAGRGNSIAQMLGNADGEVGLVMGRGQISNLLLELIGLDFAEALGLMITDDEPVTVHCAFAHFEVEEGVMTATAMALDSTDTVIFGEGHIDLAEEQLALELRPRPKDTSLVSLRVPLDVEGSLRDPDVSPQGGKLALRALAGAALYALAPPAALLALIETGPGEDTGCARWTGERTAAAESAGDARGSEADED